MMTSNTKNTATAVAATGMKAPEQGLKCPRCDSSNTKFCYYNNYSLSQPRHFCKTCRRYWTKGGALRTVPVGGGCRKAKKSSKAMLSSSTTSPAAQLVNFNLGIVPGTQFVGFNYPITAAGLDEQMFGFHHGSGVSSTNNNIASSIESLSSINQDLHWKLQQQRLAMMFGDAAQNKIEINNHVNQVEPISFQVGEGSSKGEIFGAKLMGTARSHDAAASATTWFFDTTSANYNNGRINGSNSSNYTTTTTTNASDWNGVANWSGMPQFSALP